MEDDQDGNPGRSDDREDNTGSAAAPVTEPLSDPDPGSERRPSRNIHNLKLDIPKATLASRIPEETISPDPVPMPRSAHVQSVSAQKAYHRSFSATVHGSKRNTDGSRNKRSTFQRQNSLLQRAAVLRSGSRRMMEATETFVGIGKNCDEDQNKWRLRHLRYCSMKYGKLKPQAQQEMEEREERETFHSFSGSPPPQIFDPLARRGGKRHIVSGIGTPDISESYSMNAGNSMAGGPLAVSTPPRTPVTPGNRSLGGNASRYGAQFSTTTLRRQDYRNRKDSVAKMSWKVVSAMVKGTSIMNDLVGKSMERGSYPMESLAEEAVPAEAEEGDTTEFMRDQMPTILEGESFPDEVFIVASPVEESCPAIQPRQQYPEKPAQAQKDARKPGMKRMLSVAFRRKEKREYGKGLVGNWLNRRLTRKRLNSYVENQLNTFDDHRPYFSYWISFVHIVVCIISLAVYGVAPIGFANFQESFTTTKKSLSRVSEVFSEPQNFWIGPRTKDLIHLGAKYSPCMRQDPKLHSLLLEEMKAENQSACCVRKDNSGCIQTNEDECSSLFATWIKWPDPEFDPPGYTNPDGQVEIRQSGSVCGQDPNLCADYVLGQADEWPDDITKWPVCANAKNTSDTTLQHMSCDLVGHPCCIGQEAKCEIVTKEYCDNKRGVFHSEATLCSQVNCMQDTCGLIEFRLPQSPDQIYRLWLSILLHAGVVHCAISVAFQMTVLKDVEKLAGWLRISLIYMLSGISGNLASAIFLPYRADVGPAGSHFGILACLFVEVLQSWQLLKSPGKALGKLSVIALVLFVFGLLPWIDNFAHIFGFLSGLLLSFVFLPYITFSDFDRRRKRIQVITCFLVFCAIFALLIVFFYISPLTDCKICQYLNCIEIIPLFCSNHGFTPTDRS